MKEESLNIIKENIISLFNISDSETGIKFVDKLNTYSPKYGVKPIKDIIYACNENDIVSLLSILIQGKYKEKPDKYYNPIKEVLKSETV